MSGQRIIDGLNEALEHARASTTTPWDEARRGAIEALIEKARTKWSSTLWDEAHSVSVHNGQAAASWSSSANIDELIEIAINGYLISIADLGYRLVPAQATEEMRQAADAADMACPYPGPNFVEIVNAATEAGDVLKGAGK